MDGTLTKDQTQKIFIKDLVSKKYISRVELMFIYTWFILYKAGFINDPKKALEFVLKKFKGKDISFINKETDDFFDSNVDKLIYDQSKDISSKLKEEGYRTIITSAAIEPIVRKFAEKLSFDDYISTKLEVKDNIFTGKVLGNQHHGLNKVHAIKNYLNKNRIRPTKIIAVSDHHSDIPLLEYADHPVVVNPNKKLLKYSKKNNIPVLYLSNDELFQHIKSNIINK